MAVRICRNISLNKVSRRFLNERFVKLLRNGDKTPWFVLKELNSGKSVSKLENLASEAEKVVGYHSSLLRCLLSDEISNVLVHSKKLVGSRHPLLKTARSLLYEGAGSFEAIGLIVLLMSRCGQGSNTAAAPLGEEPVSGVELRQRKLAEVAEMINAGYKVHLGMVNRTDFESSDDVKTMEFGNKITVLTGDFFLAKASVGLSELENTEVVDMMASVIGDIVEGEMMKDYRTLNDTNLDDWEEIVFKCRGSLFAKSCMSTLKLRGLSQMYQDAGFTFGKNLALLQRLSKDYQELGVELNDISSNNIAIIQQKHILPQNVLEKCLNSFIPLDESTKSKLGNHEATRNLQKLSDSYGNHALQSLKYFPKSDAKNTLENLVRHIMSLQHKG